MIETSEARLDHLARQPVEKTRRWSWPQYLAICGVPILIWEIWTIVAWLSDGPFQITRYRETGSANWIAARVLEVLMLAIALPIAVWVVRGCLRERRLTFDAMFCLASGSIVWSDVGINIFQPIFLFSANWVNLNAMCGHMPLVVNPDCGRVPDPLLFFLPFELFGVLGVAIIADKMMRWARRRWPGITTGKLVGLLFLVGLGAELAIEPALVALGLWTYTVHPLMGLHFGEGGGLRLAYTEILAGALFFALPAILRSVKDDAGRTLVERGLQHYSPLRRSAVTFMALYFCFQFIVWIPATLPDWVYGPYASDWPKKLPAYLVNDVCDAPGWQGTRYGPCPGSPGYRMPLPDSLPGKSP